MFGSLRRNGYLCNIFNFSPFSVIMALIIIAIATVCSHD